MNITDRYITLSITNVIRIFREEGTDLSYNPNGGDNPKKSKLSEPIRLRISPTEKKLWEEKCQELKSNPSGKPLPMSDLIRQSVSDFIATIDVVIFRRLQRAAAKGEPIDTKFLSYLKRKLGK